MPALFAVCTRCGYKFSYDYDFRQARCQRCRAGFDWKGNPVESESFHSSLGGTSTSRVNDSEDAPILPGEPGYEEYASRARREHERTIKERS